MVERTAEKRRRDAFSASYGFADALASGRLALSLFQVLLSLSRFSFKGITVMGNRDRMPREDTVKEGS